MNSSVTANGGHESAQTGLAAEPRSDARKLWRRAVVPQADAAQRRGDWTTAAQLYQIALARNPARAEIAIQLGHCYKKLREFGQAHEAYRSANIMRGTVDGYLQFGHLLKATGNIRAAIDVYGAAAALRDPTAPYLLGEIESMSLPALPSGAQSDKGPGAAETPIGKIGVALAWCEQDPGNAERLRAVAHLLLEAGLAAPARAFFELSFICEGFAIGACARQMAIALHTGLWRHGGPLAMPARDVPGTAAEALERLARLLGEEEETDAQEQSDTEAFLREETRLFAELTPPDAHGQPRRIGADVVAREPAANPAALVSQVYQALAGAADDPAVFAGLKDLAGTVLAAPALASFGEDPALHAGRALFNGLRHFLCENRHAIAGPFASGRALAMLWRLGEEGAPAAGGGLRIALLRLIRASQTEPSRRVCERLIVLLGHRLKRDGLAECVETSCEGGFVRAAGILLDRMARDPSRRTAEFLLWGGDLLKRNGAWGSALSLVRKAAALDPDHGIVDELIILEKTCGQFEYALALIERRLAEEPENEFLLKELLTVLPEVEDIGAVAGRVRSHPGLRELAEERLLYRLHLDRWKFDEAPLGYPGSAEMSGLAPEIAPEFARPAVAARVGGVAVLQLGRGRHVNRWGALPILRGIEAVRVRVAGPPPVVAMRVRIDGRTIAHVPAPASQTDAAAPSVVFNVWLDLSEVALGLHEVQLLFEEKDAGYRAHSELVYIDRPLAPEDHPRSGAIIRLDGPAGGRSLEERINALPSLVHPARRSCFEPPLNRVLAVRAEQLGDFVLSIPAFRRLRALFPAAQLVGLVTPANRELAEGIGVFDQVLAVDLRYDPVCRRRLLPLREQAELGRRLREFAFDLAIDLSPGASTRPLLRLSGARHTAGFNPHEFPWLSLGIEAVTHDPVNGKERVSHARVTLALVEALSAYVEHEPLTLPLPAVSRAALARYGLPADRPYLLLHCGARLRMKRWPLAHYIALAQLALAETEIEVAILADTPAEVAQIAAAGLEGSGRFRCIAGPVPFADLDALVAHCAVFVGNDTGPKHLAALRGTKVISVHMGQVNWDEWGQEGDGLIVTRRVPCYGCGIEEAEDCGKDLPCLVHIKPSEVLAAVRQILES